MDRVHKLRGRRRFRRPAEKETRPGVESLEARLVLSTARPLAAVALPLLAASIAASVRAPANAMTNLGTVTGYRSINGVTMTGNESGFRFKVASPVVQPTADPTRPGFAYVVWDRTVEDLATGAFTGPAYFSMTTDGGRTWSTPEAIYTPPVGAQTLDNQIVVLPDGTLVDMFSEGTLAGGSVDVIRSTDHGRTWSAPIAITPSVDPVPIVDPDTGAAVRSANVIPDIAVDPRTGALYVVTQQLYDLPNGPLDPGINLFTSTDGGRTWSAPVRVNQTPTNIPAADQQAFDPMVAVAADGTVAVSYDDFRNNTPAPGALTDRWIVFYRPCGFWAPPGGVTNPANWGGEQRLTTSSFDLEQAPNIEGQTLSGYFLGDDQGLAAQGDRFLSLFTVAGTNGPGTASIDFDRSDQTDASNAMGTSASSGRVSKL